jgi:hypothetical protein
MDMKGYSTDEIGLEIWLGWYSRHGELSSLDVIAALVNPIVTLLLPMRITGHVS